MLVIRGVSRRLMIIARVENSVVEKRRTETLKTLLYIHNSVLCNYQWHKHT